MSSPGEKQRGEIRSGQPLGNSFEERGLAGSADLGRVQTNKRFSQGGRGGEIMLSPGMKARIQPVRKGIPCLCHQSKEKKGKQKAVESSRKKPWGEQFSGSVEQNQILN